MAAAADGAVLNMKHIPGPALPGSSPILLTPQERESGRFIYKR